MKILFFVFACLISAQASYTFAAEIPAPLIQDLTAELKAVFGESAKIYIDTKNASATKLLCHANTYTLKVAAEPSELSSAAYSALRDMGFLYPHPRITLRPNLERLKSYCGKTFQWQPRLKDRGFHLHLEHPNEWVDGYFMGHPQIAKDLSWWLVRNGQNLLQLEMIRISNEELHSKVNPLVQQARSLGLRVGLSFSFAMVQQHSFRLIPFWRDLLGYNTTEALVNRLAEIYSLVPVDFMSFELGSSEFTSSREARTIEWMNAAANFLHEKNAQMLVKSHASSNQYSKVFGNFNFLPQFASPLVGVEAHTVFFYGLRDPLTPMYGRHDFSDMEAFMLKENHKRLMWYFPETSYWVGMDQDIPLFLTDYLVARTADADVLEQDGIKGQINFSSGQELGSWLFDWQVALLADKRTQGDPMYALGLLGENKLVWQPILRWQSEFFKSRQLIQMITTTNLMDELSPFFAKVHERILLRELRSRPALLQQEIDKLRVAISEAPTFENVKNEELKQMLQVTLLRVRHALALREAIREQQLGQNPEVKLHDAEAWRIEAKKIISTLIAKYSRYPESWIFEEHINPTSYGFGYLFTASNLYYWEREEEIVRGKRWNPFFQSIVNPFKILF